MTNTSGTQHCMIGTAIAICMLWQAPRVHSEEEVPTKLTPIRFSQLEDAGFDQPRFDKLDEQQQAAFYEAYTPDTQMLSRLTLGTQNQKITECIAGEAPMLSAAKRTFPSHYPLMGRMKNTPGTFVWHEKKLLLKTKTQIYHVDEYHILYRLEQLGLKRNSGPQSVTLNAVWIVNKIDGLRLIYLETAKLK